MEYKRKYPVGIQNFEEIRTKGFVYIDKTAAEALAQIDERGYDEPFRNDGRTVVKVGINFGSTERNITEWVSEQVD